MSESLADPAGFGNPASSLHAYGRSAEARVAAAREQVAALIGAQAEALTWTSGATEADNLALKGVAEALQGTDEIRFDVVSDRDVAHGESSLGRRHLCVEDDIGIGRGSLCE